MQFRIIVRRILVPVIFLGIAGAILLYSFLNQKDVPREVGGGAVFEEVATSSTEVTRSELPVRLKIPRINLDSEIEYVGLTADGEMATPKAIKNVAWYEPGVRPGEVGSAVIAGHYGWENGKASAFDDLQKLRVGDKIYIEDDVGTVTTFVVRASRRYDPEGDASEVFDSKDGKAHLNLVTCEGNWDAGAQSYSKRLVVFTDREEVLEGVR